MCPRNSQLAIHSRRILLWQKLLLIAIAIQYMIVIFFFTLNSQIKAPQRYRDMQDPPVDTIPESKSSKEDVVKTDELSAHRVYGDYQVHCEVTERLYVLTPPP